MKTYVINTDLEPEQMMEIHKIHYESIGVTKSEDMEFMDLVDVLDLEILQEGVKFR